MMRFSSLPLLGFEGLTVSHARHYTNVHQNWLGKKATTAIPKFPLYGYSHLLKATPDANSGQ